MKYVYVACFYPDEDGGYTVVIPDLEGAVTEGNDLLHAIEMANDCASGWIVGELKEKRDIPKARNIRDIQLDDELPNGFKSYVYVDLIEYKKKYNNKSIKKTLTIPGWLNDLAEEKHINFSGVLQEALKEHLGVKEYN